MVDCDFFTEFNQLLIIENNRILLDSKNTDYTIEMYNFIYIDYSQLSNAKKLINVLQIISIQKHLLRLFME